jgi:hypothetical protein
MTTLTINDLCRNEEMGRDGLADVRGGMLNLTPADQSAVWIDHFWGFPSYSPTLNVAPGMNLVD